MFFRCRKSYIKIYQPKNIIPQFEKFYRIYLKRHLKKKIYFVSPQIILKMLIICTLPFNICGFNATLGIRLKSNSERAQFISIPTHPQLAAIHSNFNTI